MYARTRARQRRRVLARLGREIPEARQQDIPWAERLRAAAEEVTDVARPGITWLVMLTAAQSADVLTTTAGHLRGAIEASPVSRELMAEGGIPLFWSFKLLLVLALAVVLILGVRWSRRDRRRGASVTKAVVAVSQLATFGLLATALGNLVVLGSS